MGSSTENGAPVEVTPTGAEEADPRPALPGALNVLGQRLKAARNRLGYNQDRVARPEFTKSYVSAVERGKARPSLKALELMAARLEIPVSELLALPGSPESGPTPRTQAAALAWHLDQARRAIDTGHARQGLDQLAALETEYGAGLAAADPQIRFRLHYLRGLAHIQLEEPAPAHKALDQAVPAAEALGDGGESVARIDHLRGRAYYQQNLPQRALELHAQGLAAIQAGTIRDLGLQLAIYSNLAQDYMAVGAGEQAVATYQAALTAAAAVQNLERQSGSYWERGQARREIGDLDAARRYSAQALGIQEAAQNMTYTAQIHINLAAILADRGEYAPAAQALARAGDLLLGSGNRAALSTLHQRAAAIELRQGHLETAAQRVALALQLSAAANQAAGEAAPAAILRVALRAQAVAGQVAEAQGDPARADKLFRAAVKAAQTHEAWDIASELAQTYAEILTERGQHEQAHAYYRAALKRHPSSRP